MRKASLQASNSSTQLMKSKSPDSESRLPLSICAPGVREEDVEMLHRMGPPGIGGRASASGAWRSPLRARPCTLKPAAKRSCKAGRVGPANCEGTPVVSTFDRVNHQPSRLSHSYICDTCSIERSCGGETEITAQLPRMCYLCHIAAKHGPTNSFLIDFWRYPRCIVWTISTSPRNGRHKMNH